jgi:hypothetical protein
MTKLENFKPLPPIAYSIMPNFQLITMTKFKNSNP